MAIVVVGHGRSPEGKHWGNKIDKHTVVRMWDWDWQPELDYGRRYDFGLFVLTPKGASIFNEHNVLHPSRGWLAYYGKPVPSNAIPGRIAKNMEILDTERWAQIAQESLGGAGLTGRLTLTRGCAAAAWAITHSPRKGLIILVGFDNVLAGTNRPIEESFAPAYWDAYMSRFSPDKEKVYPIGQPKTATHDMAIELPLLRMLAKHCTVELRFAQEVWK